MINTKKIAASGIALAASLILSLIENALPPIIPALPYAKIGFSNIVILFLFVASDIRYGYVVLLLKCVLSAIFAGAPTMMLYSIPAAAVSFTIMAVMLKGKGVSVVAISVVGAITHNAVQIFVGMALAGASVATLMPYMMLAGAASGFVTGVIVWLIVRRLPNSTLDFLS